jgi:hypothetical protein
VKLHVAACALALSGTALAHEPPSHTHWWHELDPAWYVGAGAGQSTFDALPAIADDGSLTTSSVDDTGTSWRLFAGVGFGRYVAFELGHVDLGQARLRAQSDGSSFLWNAGPVSESVTLDGQELALVGRLPVAADWALFGRIARLRWESAQRIAGDTQCCGQGPFKESDDGYDTTLAGGIQYDGFRAFRVALEYGAVTFAIPVSYEDEADVASLAVSLAYLF